jgi:hypothetical protein
LAFGRLLLTVPDAFIRPTEGCTTRKKLGPKAMGEKCGLDWLSVSIKLLHLGGRSKNDAGLER